MKRTFRSPWGVCAALLQGILGVLFALILLAPDAGRGERLVFGLLGLVMIAGAVRASLTRVEQDGHALTIHGFTGNRQADMQAVSPEVIDDKVVAVVWAPVLPPTRSSGCGLGRTLSLSSRALQSNWRARPRHSRRMTH